MGGNLTNTTSSLSCTESSKSHITHKPSKKASRLSSGARPWKKAVSSVFSVRPWKSLLAILCCITLTVQMTPAFAIGSGEEPSLSPSGDKSGTALVDAASYLLSEDADAMPAEIVGEDVALREEAVKYYRLSDGSYQAASYALPVHYERNGQLEDIDNTLMKTTGTDGAARYENASNSLLVSLPAEGGLDGALEVAYGGHALSWVLEDIQLSSAEAYSAKPGRTREAAGTEAALAEKDAALAKDTAEDTADERTRIKRENEERMALGALSSAVAYTTKDKDVSLVYELSSVTLKESIVLGSVPGQRSFSFLIDSTGLTPKLSEDGSVTCTGEDGTPALVIAAPWMADAKGEFSDAIKVTLAETEEGSWRYTLIPDASWLEDTGRTYPVTIDPTIQPAYNFANTHDATGFMSSTTTTVYNAWDTSYERLITKVGYRVYGSSAYELAGLSHMPLPAEVTANCRIIDAVMVYRYHDNGYVVCPEDLQVNAYKVTSSWDWSQNKTHRSDAAPLMPTYDSTVLDYEIANWYQYLDGWQAAFNVTRAAQEWLTSGANYGILLRAGTPYRGYGDQLTMYYDSDYSSLPAYSPTLIVTYRNSIGLEGYWTAHTQGLGRSGTGYIKDFSTDLTWVHEDVSLDAGVNSIALSHVYNSNSRAYYPSASNPGLYAGRVGVGWNMSLVQYLMPNLGGDQAFRDKYPFIYVDGDGTEHYIYGTASSVPVDLRNKDEDGLGLTCSSPKTDTVWDYRRLTAKDGTILTFNTSGNLRRIIDPNGNITTLNFSSLTNNKPGGGNNYLTSVVTAAGTVSLTYTDYVDAGVTLKRLSSVKDAAGRVTSYTYTGDLLTKITYPDATYTTFTYTSNLLAQVTGTDSSKVIYATSANKTYTKAQEAGTTGTLGNGYTIATDYLQTTYTDIKNTSLKETYQFNTFGNTTCVYNQDGMALTQEYTNVPGWANNRLASSASSGATTENKVMDAAFAYGFTYWSALGSGTVTVNATERYSNARSAKVVATSTVLNSTATIAQAVPSSPGKTYTLSGYVKCVGVTKIPNTGGGAALEAITNNYTTFHYSDLLTGTTDTTLNGGWKRVSVTFTLGSGETINQVSGGLYNATGTVYVAGLRLEEGAVANQANLCSDTGFERTFGNSATAHTGTKSLMLAGNAGSSFQGYTLGVSGSPGDVYTIGGWAKAASVPEGDFCLAAAILYPNATTRWLYFDFNKNVRTWQYVAASFDTTDPANPSLGYSDIHFYMLYHYNANTAYFDDVFVYRDNANAYSYDASGNLISSESAAAAASSFAYNGSSIAKVANPDGTGYEYHYDAKKNVTSATTSEGQAYRFSYDARGNATSAEVLSASQQTSSVREGVAYFIRNQGTGQYLDVANLYTYSGAPVVQAPFNGGKNQQFKLVSTSDGYYTLTPLHATSMRLDVAGGSTAQCTPIQLYTPNNADAQRFKVIPNDDGSYRIATKVTSDDGVITIEGPSLAVGHPATQIIYVNVAHQRWYFEEVKTPRSDVPKDGDVYQIRSSRSGLYLNVQGGSSAAGTLLVQDFFTGDTNQRFMLKDAGGGYFKLVPMHAKDKVVQIGTTLSPGETNIYMPDIAVYTGATSQLFRFVANATNTAYTIRPKYDDNYRLHLNGAFVGQQANLCAYPALYYDPYIEAQEWVLERVTASVTSSAAYDATGSFLTGATDARGNTSTYSYTANKGLLASATDAKGTKTTYSYNASNDRLASVTSGSASVSYSYTSSGQLQAVAHNGFSYTFSYDSFGNILSTSVGGQTLGTSTYGSGNGNLLTFTYGNGASVTYAYDKYDRVVSRKWNTSTASTVTYDARGNIYKTTDGITGISTTYEYDLIGRPLSVSSSNGVKEWVSYDTKDRVAESAYSLGNGATTYKTSYMYGTVASGQKESLVYGIKLNGTQKVGYAYDTLGRLTTRSVGTSLAYKTTYRYLDNADGTTTYLLAGIKNGSSTEVTFTYDALGNITHIYEGATLLKSYTYDALGQLTRENSTYANATYTYSYDSAGNILSKTTYAYTTGTLGGILQSQVYVYGDASWKDKLTAVKLHGAGTPSSGNLISTQNITYDAIGNPTSYMGKTMAWTQGRRLSSVSASGLSATYSYNDAGIRASKTVASATTTYTLSGSTILRQQKGSTTLDFYYDESGQAYGFKHNSTEYWYVRNGQGDVIGIINSAGTQVVSYRYDAWGNPISVTGTLATTIGADNPLRYRGYYFDVETGFYYCNSRYYDPGTGRWINADGLVDNRGLITQNLFAYCANNPVTHVDTSGQFFVPLLIIAFVALCVAAVTLTGCSSSRTSAPISTTQFDDMSNITDSPYKPPALAQEQQREQLVIAQTIYGESGGRYAYPKDWFDGQHAVASVIYNRAMSGSLNYSDVCTAPNQFDGYSRGKSIYEAGSYDTIMWDNAMSLAGQIISGEFTIHPLLNSQYKYFHSETEGNPAYIAQVRAKPETVILGGNMFYINWP